MRRDHLDGSMLLLVDCSIIGWCELLLDEEGIEVPIEISEESHVVEIDVPQFITKYTDFVVHRDNPILDNLDQDTRLESWILLDHSDPQG
jgi:hypothetical protein